MEIHFWRGRDARILLHDSFGGWNESLHNNFYIAIVDLSSAIILIMLLVFSSPLSAEIDYQVNALSA
jgi:hypothetical protein